LSLYKYHDVCSWLLSQQMTITVLLTVAICISEEITNDGIIYKKIPGIMTVTMMVTSV